jgi:hypothetical protein
MSPQLQYAKYYEYDQAANRTLLRHVEKVECRAEDGQ